MQFASVYTSPHERKSKTRTSHAPHGVISSHLCHGLTSSMSEDAYTMKKPSFSGTRKGTTTPGEPPPSEHPIHEFLISTCPKRFEPRGAPLEGPLFASTAWLGSTASPLLSSLTSALLPGSSARSRSNPAGPSHRFRRSWSGCRRSSAPVSGPAAAASAEWQLL